MAHVYFLTLSDPNSTSGSNSPVGHDSFSSWRIVDKGTWENLGPCAESVISKLCGLGKFKFHNFQFLSL